MPTTQLLKEICEEIREVMNEIEDCDPESAHDKLAELHKKLVRLQDEEDEHGIQRHSIKVPA